MNLVEKYPECFVEYQPDMVGEYIVGIKCVGERLDKGWQGEIEKRVDIQRARKAGCRSIPEVCDYLNGAKR